MDGKGGVDEMGQRIRDGSLLLFTGVARSCCSQVSNGRERAVPVREPAAALGQPKAVDGRGLCGAGRFI